MLERIHFGRLREVIPPPNLIENQIKSFQDFIQLNATVSERQCIGLQAVFKEVFPVESYDGRFGLKYLHYKLINPKHTEIKCICEGTSYVSALYITLQLCEDGINKNEEIYMGELPIITHRGSFIINGVERVVVSQLHRSPGICFEKIMHTSGKLLYSFRIIPDRGTWIEVQFDQHDLLYVYLDRRRRRRKFLIATLLRAMGYNTDYDILSLFYKIEKYQAKNNLKISTSSNYVLVEDIIDANRGIIIARAFEPLTTSIIKSLQATDINKCKIIDISIDDGIIIRSLKKDITRNEEEALLDIYKRLRPGEPPTTSNARSLLNRLFQNIKRYDLGRVGRYKINQKLGLNTSIDERIINSRDIVEATKYLCKLKYGEGIVDDIDHLGGRRVRNVGELLANQCRIGLSRTERLVKERMGLYDQSIDSITPQKLINPKSLTIVIRDFFARSQLSQFMDQINPLSEITHKRRLSALGPGGLNRERAGFEVRDVHPSHYGRICPVETPEGPNIGLINSLSTYAKINEYGFIETPYRKIKNSLLSEEIHFLTADQEENHTIAQSNSESNSKGELVGSITVRRQGEVYEVEPQEVHYIDISPKQLVSVAAGLIPFLEHDDANRALMGSNMQRQGVPLLHTQSPLVGTGLENRVARDSKNVIISRQEGTVAYVDSNCIVITKDGCLCEEFDLKNIHIENLDSQADIYKLRKFLRSNAATCFNQRPIVSKGQNISFGQVIADGASTDQGELALGYNVLAAFMPWNGYNYEDSILISEELIKKDIFTSIHIEEFEVTARDTKLGPEEVTRDIPNVGEDVMKNLNRNGIIRIGAEVRPGDILVGKITPKSETELAPEEKLLRAIFGEKAADVKDTSLVIPSGVFGIVMDVKLSTRLDGRNFILSSIDKKRNFKKINEEFRSRFDDLREDLTESLANILLGEKIPLDVFNNKTKEIIIPANRKITKTLLRRLASVVKNIQIDPSPIKIKIMEIVKNYYDKFDILEKERSHKLVNIESDLETLEGVIKNVKVYIATKRKIQVGDKMAGRHGNKGVVAKIVPSEDMPYLLNGTSIQIVLNPLGVPSRMNVGQVLEMHLGWACKALNIKIATPIFDGITEDIIRHYLLQSGLPSNGKTKLIDGHTGQSFDQEISVGFIYMMKLNHLVADKIHARSVGPYSLITQQPLGGKAQYGGQRFGEMEVWALEAYGAAYTLQELLTVKSDDVQGRTKIYEQLVKGDNTLSAGTPQSFNVLMKEMQSLCLDVRLSSTK